MVCASNTDYQNIACIIKTTTTTATTSTRVRMYDAYKDYSTHYSTHDAYKDYSHTCTHTLPLRSPAREFMISEYVMYTTHTHTHAHRVTHVVCIHGIGAIVTIALCAF